MKIPIACTLTEAEMRERRRTILDSVRGAVSRVTALPAGYAYHFEAKPEALVQLARLVELERVCCAFLTFRIIAEAGSDAICLEITGPPDAKPLIDDIFGT
jgi:hypothetical protein